MSDLFSENYKRRLKNYLLWATMDRVGTAGSTKSVCTAESDCGDTPENVMYVFETHGQKRSMSMTCTSLDRLYRYLAGKNARDFYVSNWVKDVNEGLFAAEEFICTGGMDIEEFVAVFNRYPDPWLLRRLWREEKS